MKKNEKPDLIDHILGWIFTNPFKALYFVALIAGFVIRMDLSLRNKGILHPDELYQSLEIAHHMVYGSGYIPPEFRSEFDPPSYASSRSWLFPLIFASIMRFGEFFGLDYHDGSLFLIRVMLGINATLIIPATKKLTFQLTKNEICAFISAVYIAFWFRMIEYGVRSFTNTFFLPYLFFGIAFTLKMLEEKNFSIKNSIIFAITVPLTVYIRLDLGIIIFSFFLVTFKRENLNSYMKLGLIGVVTWLLAGYYDYTMYEGAKFMSVPINWYTFNVIEGYSKNFGVSSPLYYVGVLIGLDRLWPWLLLIIFTTIFYKGNELDLENKNFNELFDGYYITLKSSIIIWIIYSNFWSG
ncbi:MAG: hypothetical protein OEY49_16600, partial [Candidatus Heimdallarchaeota archaeon]|nr:hypothetical protein [Candidatus Heimdallarchaeota archaeon]